MKKTNKILLIIIAIIVVLALIVTGLFLLLPKEEVQRVEENVIEESQEVKQETVEEEPEKEKKEEIGIDTSDWQTYENKSFNYTIKYPVNWKVDDYYVENEVHYRYDFILLGKGAPPFLSMMGPPSGLIVNIEVIRNNENLSTQEIIKKDLLSVTSLDKLLINNNHAIKVMGITKLKKDSYGYYILKDNKLYNLEIWQWSKDKQSDKEMLDVIVNNFSFIK